MKLIRFISMKIFYFLALIFYLQSIAIAEDIRDFQIDGMTTGESLLNFFSKTEINESLKNPFYYPKSKNMMIISLYPSDSSTYERYDIHIKKNDINYVIYSIKGLVKILFDEFLKKKNSVVSEIENIFLSSETKDYIDNYGNAYGDSEANITDFILTNGRVRVWCAKWDQNNELVKSYNWWDSLNVNMSSEEQMDFITNEAYK